MQKTFFTRFIKFVTNNYLYNMLTNKIQINYNHSNCPTRSKVAFRQIQPDYFFIKMEKYGKNAFWGNYMVNLVNFLKGNILAPASSLENNLNKTARKYKVFYVTNYKKLWTKIPNEKVKGLPPFLRAFFFGTKKRFYHIDFFGTLDKNGKYKEYYPKFEEKLETNLKELPIRRKRNTDFKDFKKHDFLVYQAQNNIDNNKLVLTQLAYKLLGNNQVDKSKIFLIHPPLKSKKILLNCASENFETLKQYKNKNLSEDDINIIYRKIGKIHWCLAQGMPFLRGSAAIAEVITKSLFESLRIQIKPWKNSFSPDLEAFIRSSDDYSNNYRSFFKIVNY